MSPYEPLSNDSFNATPTTRLRWLYSVRYTLNRLGLLTRTLGAQFLVFVVLMRLLPPMLSLSLLIGVASQTLEVSLGGFAAGIVALTYAGMIPFYNLLARKIGHTRVLMVTGIANIPALALISWQLVQLSVKSSAIDTTGVLLASVLAGITTPPMASIMRSYWSREYSRAQDRKMLNSTIALESMFEVISLPLAAVMTGSIAVLLSPIYCLFALIIINMFGMLFVLSRINKPLFPAVTTSAFHHYSQMRKVASTRNFVWLPLLGAAFVGLIIGATQSSLASFTLSTDSITSLGFYVTVMGLSGALAGSFLLLGRVRIGGWGSWLITGALLIALSMLLSIPVTSYGVILTMIGLGLGTGAATVCMESVTTSASLRGYLELALTSSQATMTAGLSLGLVWGAMFSERFGYQAGMLIPLIASTLYFLVGHIYGFIWRKSYEERLETQVYNQA